MRSIAASVSTVTWSVPPGPRPTTTMRPVIAVRQPVGQPVTAAGAPTGGTTPSAVTDPPTRIERAEPGVDVDVGGLGATPSRASGSRGTDWAAFDVACTADQSVSAVDSDRSAKPGSCVSSCVRASVCWASVSGRRRLRRVPALITSTWIHSLDRAGARRRRLVRVVAPGAIGERRRSDPVNSSGVEFGVVRRVPRRRCRRTWSTRSSRPTARTDRRPRTGSSGGGDARRLRLAGHASAGISSSRKRTRNATARRRGGAAR